MFQKMKMSDTVLSSEEDLRISRAELEKIINYVKIEMESQLWNKTGFKLFKLKVLLQITFLQNQKLQTQKKHPLNISRIQVKFS